ncbi:MAG TPA: hypothetical protein VFM61_03710 [Pseudidiomarina sp.]|nr:hypothetical protein [Pseudidiomarina sp.]
MRHSVFLVIVVILAGCQPAIEQSDTNVLELLTELDQQQLPNAKWKLTSDTLQLSFCRSRTNEALLAASEELNRWRLVAEASAFPRQRREGLEALATFARDFNIYLYQEWGTVSSQNYRIAYRSDETAPNVFNALARIGRDRSICFSSLDQSLNPE